jgi:hypothetical protein
LRSQRIPKQTATVIIEGRRKGGRPRTRWADEVEDKYNGNVHDNQTGNVRIT